VAHWSHLTVSIVYNSYPQYSSQRDTTKATRDENFCFSRRYAAVE